MVYMPVMTRDKRPIYTSHYLRGDRQIASPSEVDIRREEKVLWRNSASTGRTCSDEWVDVIVRGVEGTAGEVRNHN